MECRHWKAGQAQFKYIYQHPGTGRLNESYRRHGSKPDGQSKQSNNTEEAKPKVRKKKKAKQTEKESPENMNKEAGRLGHGEHDKQTVKDKGK